MPKVKVNDIEMYYEVHGEGTPLVIINGYGGTSQGTKFFFDIPEFSKHHRCILLDNRGIGQSTTSIGPYSMKVMASDVAELLDASEIKEARAQVRSDQPPSGLITPGQDPSGLITPGQGPSGVFTEAEVNLLASRARAQ